jgi:hypothetical protein
MNTPMKRIIILVLLAVNWGYVKAQEVVYDENAEVRTVESFTGIEVSGTISLYLSQGSENAVAISAGDPKYNSKIKTEVSNGILRISVDGGLWNGMGWANRKLKAYVSVVNAKSLNVSGASFVSISGILKGDALQMDVSGASEFKGAIEVAQLNLGISGASVVRVSGTAKNALIDASGACKANAFDLVTETCKASASGASNIRIMAQKELNASASGGANIYYRGEPQSISINSSAGASIKKRSSAED